MIRRIDSFDIGLKAKLFGPNVAPDLVSVPADPSVAPQDGSPHVPDEDKQK